VEEMELLVTGATGQLGREVVPRLLKRGDRVSLVVRNLESGRSLFPDCEIIEGNVVWPDLGVKQPMKLDAVYHLAADIDLGSRHNERVWATNYDGTANVIRFCEANSVSHLFYAGTAYTEKERNVYEKSKKAAESLVDASQIKRKTIFKIGILVPGLKDTIKSSNGALYQFVNAMRLVVERAESAKKRLHRQLRSPLAQRKLRVKGLPDARLNLVPVDLVADFIVSTTSPGKFWLTHPNPPRLCDLAVWVGEVLDVPIEFASDFEMSDVETLFHKSTQPFLPYLQGDDFVSHLRSCPEIDRQFVKESVSDSISAFKDMSAAKWVK